MKLVARLGLSMIALASASIAHAETPIALSVQADKPGAVIDRQIFGQFAEHLGQGVYGGIWVGKDSKIPNVRGIRSDVVAALRAIHVPTSAGPAAASPTNIIGAGASARRTSAARR